MMNEPVFATYFSIFVFTIILCAIGFLPLWLYGRRGEQKKWTPEVFRRNCFIWILVATVIMTFTIFLFWDDHFSPAAIRKNAEVARKMAPPKATDTSVNASNGPANLSDIELIRGLKLALEKIDKLDGAVVDQGKKVEGHEERIGRLESGFSNTVAQITTQQRDDIEKSGAILTPLTPPAPPATEIDGNQLVINGVLNRLRIEEEATKRAQAAIAEMDARTQRKFAEIEEHLKLETTARHRIEERIKAIEAWKQTNTISTTPLRTAKVAWQQDNTNRWQIRQECAFAKKWYNHTSGHLTIEAVGISAPGITQHDAGKEMGIVMNRWFDAEGRDFLSGNKSQEEFFYSLSEVARKQFRKSGWPQGKITIQEARYTLTKPITP